MLAEVLGYSNLLKAIRTHIDCEDKEEMSTIDVQIQMERIVPFNPFATQNR